MEQGILSSADEKKRGEKQPAFFLYYSLQEM